MLDQFRKLNPSKISHYTIFINTSNGDLYTVLNQDHTLCKNQQHNYTQLQNNPQSKANKQAATEVTIPFIKNRLPMFVFGHKILWYIASNGIVNYNNFFIICSYLYNKSQFVFMVSVSTVNNYRHSFERQQSLQMVLLSTVG